MNSSVLTVLPTVLRAVRYPTSGLAAVLAVIADQTQSNGVAVIATSCEDGPAELLGVGGSAAGRFGRLGPVGWADDRFNRSGDEFPDSVEGMPWEPGSQVVWDSMRGNECSFSLIAFGEAPDQGSLQRLSGLAFVIAELIMARRARADLRAQLKTERQDRAILAASLQHDLRTPLSGILGFASILQNDDERPREEVAEILDMIVAEAEHMAEIVAEGLRRDEAGPDAPLQMQPVDPVEVAENVAEAARQARGGEIILGVSDHTMVTDRTRLTRALLNLVDNALKYSPEGSAVRVSGNQDGEHYRFVVADSGPGVPDEMVSTLFQPYSTDPHRNDGTGLGLHSVATIARELDGRVSYARHDGWTTFSLWVAANETPTNHPEIPELVEAKA